MFRVSFLVFTIISSARVSHSHEDIQEYEMVDPYYEVDRECVEWSRAPEYDIELVQTLKSPSTSEGKCLLACMYKKVNILTQEGRYSPQGSLVAAARALALHPRALRRAEKLVDFCTQEVENITDDERGCEIAAAIFSCVADKNNLFESDSESSEEDEDEP